MIAMFILAWFPVGFVCFATIVEGAEHESA